MSKFVTIVRNSIVLATALAASVPAFAGTLDTAPTLAVSYADLDLSSTADQHRLHTRLASAARSVCEGTIRPGTNIQTEFSACMSKAITKGTAEIAMLTNKSQPHVAVR
jgi:UrcA family protein